MTNNTVNFNEPYMSGNEINYLKDVIQRNSFGGNGYYTKKCQNIIKNFINVDTVLLTDSCTSALEISALLLRQWDKVQEVILPSYTFSSTAAAFARAGYKIIFAEIDPATMMIDYEDVKSKTTSNTVAVVVVHYGGFGVNVEKFKQLCNDKSIYLIEDAAQAYGCHSDKKYLGTIGDLGCYSFHETKNLHAGLAGALVVNNDSFKERAKLIWERGTNREDVLKGLVDKYSWVEIGGSFYPTELQAAFLYAQLLSIDKNILQRKEIFYGYYHSFNQEKVDNLIFHKIQDNFQTNYHAFWILFKSISECDFVRLGLKKLNISAYIGYVPLHSSTVGQRMGYIFDDLPITQECSQMLLRLPLHNKMKVEESYSISSVTIDLIKEYRLKNK
jgi:dTDP-4-amino-4,6-dideoxygalactose transaminase